MRLVLRLLALCSIALVTYLLLWPVRIEPVAWDPPQSPGLVGTWASNGKLAGYELLAKDLPGPEALASDGGRVFTGTRDGRLVRLGPRGKTREFAKTGGRPLGIKQLQDGSFVVADAYKGLLHVDANGQVKVLVDSYKGAPLIFTDDVDVLPDGRLLFTDATTRFRLHEFEEDALEHRSSGRLFIYDPRSKQTSLVLDRLAFANGVAASADGTFALVNETWAYRVRRVYLSGPRKGQDEVLADNLPGFPDNITYDRAHDVFWVALGSPRAPAVDMLAPFPFLRRIVARLPKGMHPAAKRHAMVLALRPDGRVAGFFDDPRPDSYSPVTSILALNDKLYLGSYQHNGIARVNMPALSPASAP